MKAALYTILLCVLGISLLGSCKDEELVESNEEKIAKRTQMLTAGSSKIWKMSSLTIDGVESIEDCSKDDTWEFKNDGTLLITLNTLCLNEEEEDKSSDATEYTWDIGGEGTSLTNMQNGNIIPFACISLRGGTITIIDDNTLQFGVVIDQGPGKGSKQYLWTYTAQ